MKLAEHIDDIGHEVGRRLTPFDVTGEGPEQAIQGLGGFPTIASSQHFIDVAADNMRSGAHLVQRQRYLPVQACNVGDPALQAMERMHDWNVQHSSLAVDGDRCSELDGPSFQRAGLNPDDVANEVDLDPVVTNLDLTLATKGV